MLCKMKFDKNGKVYLLLILMVLVEQSLSTPTSEYYRGQQRCKNTPVCTCKWSGGKRVADCSNSGLTKVPNTLNPEIQSLILDGNPLGRLKKDAFKSAGLLNLQRLSLAKCGLTDVHDDAFRDLKILVELNLSSNNLTRLRPKTFDGNNNLKAIQLTNNPLTR